MKRTVSVFFLSLLLSGIFVSSLRLQPKAAGSQQTDEVYGLNINIEENPWNSSVWIDKLNKTGAKWVRAELRYFNKSAPLDQDHQAKYNQTFRMLKLAKDAGLKVLGFVDEKTAEWDKASNDFSPITGLGQWRTLMNFTMAGYGELLDAVEMWNEPDLVNMTKVAEQNWYMNASAQNYVNMLQVLYEEVKTYDPDIQVLAGALGTVRTTNSTPGWGYGGYLLQNIIALDASSYCDSYSIHIYDGYLYPNESLQNAASAYIKAKALVDNKQVWVTELGANHAVTEQDQADFMSNSLIKLRLETDCPNVMWYCYFNPLPEQGSFNWDGNEPPHGLVRQDDNLTERFAYFIFQSFTAALIVPDDYPTIQEAVDAAISGDTILVREGTYYEHIVITGKNDLTIIGENRKTIVNGNGTGAIFSLIQYPDDIHLTGITLTGFTLLNATIGINLLETRGITLSNNLIERCWTGINFESDYRNPIVWSEGNVLDSVIYHCDVGVDGGTMIRNSTLALNNVGIIRGEVVTDNIIEFNLIGIDHPTPSGGIVTNNTFLSNFLSAISFRIEDSDIPYAGGSIFHNDFINNTKQAYVEGGVNTRETIWNDVYPIGGNYWSDYGGVDEFGGPYQNLTGSDGIGDIAYTIHEDSEDNYPFMELLPLPIPPLPGMQLTPRARFSNYPNAPVMNESIDFDASWSKDIDGEIVAYTWNFGDGTGLVETGPQTTHSYDTTGMYNVSLTVTDNDGLKDTVTIPVSVGKMHSTVTILADPAEITVRENTAISGAIIPKRSDANVTVWCRFASEDWNILTNLTTNVNSEYQYSWVPSKTGTYALKASWTGDEYTLADESAIIEFNCLNISSSISIATSSASTYAGYRVNVTGTLRDMYGVPVSNETAVLYYAFSGITTWTPITSDKTDNSGSYSATWIPPATGDFVIKAEWAGNATHSETDSVITLSALSYEDQYVFTVESNSTITGLTFDTNNKTLTFTAAGTNGTSGYTKVTADKSLLPDIALLRVNVDGAVYDYTVTETNDSWIILFTYDHSSHLVEIALDYTIPEFQFTFLLLLFLITSLFLATIRQRSAGLQTQTS